VESGVCFANIFILNHAQASPCLITLCIIDLSVCHASIISLNLGISKLLALPLYHNAADFQLIKRLTYGYQASGLQSLHKCLKVVDASNSICPWV